MSQKSSGCTKGFLLILLTLIGSIWFIKRKVQSYGHNPSPDEVVIEAPGTQAQPETHPAKIPESERFNRDDLEIVNLTFRKPGSGGILEFDIDVDTKGAYDVKDLRIKVMQYGQSGTEIQSSRHTLYQTFKAGHSTSIKGFNAGSTNQQAVNFSVRISGGDVIR